MLHHQHLLVMRQEPLDRPATERGRPADQVDRVERPLVVDADLLEVVEQPGLGRPEASRASFERGEEGLAPLAEAGIVEVEGEP